MTHCTNFKNQRFHYMFNLLKYTTCSLFVIPLAYDEVDSPRQRYQELKRTTYPLTQHSNTVSNMEQSYSAVIVATETNCGGLYCNLATIPRCEHALERENLANVLENISRTIFRRLLSCITLL